MARDKRSKHTKRKHCARATARRAPLNSAARSKRPERPAKAGHISKRQTVLRFIGSLSRKTLHDGDVLVLESPEAVSHQQYAAIQKAMHCVGGRLGVKNLTGLVLDGGLTLKALLRRRGKR